MKYNYLIITSLIYADIINQLGWVENNNKCLGFFAEDQTEQHPKNLIEIKSHAPSLWDGLVWKFDQKIKINNNKFILEMNDGTWKIKQQIWEFNKFGKLTYPPIKIISKQGEYNTKTQQAFLKKIYFRIKKTNKKFLDLWGKSENANWDKNITQMQNAMLSICSPRNNIWYIKAKKVSFNHKKNTIVMHHAVPYLLGMPVFYFPWLETSTEKKRSTGFLMPRIYINSTMKYLSLPFYLNIKPQWDLTIEPLIGSNGKPGTKIENRYLTNYGITKFNYFYIKDSSSHHVLEEYTNLKYKNISLYVKGYHSSDENVLVNYPNFINVPNSLVPWNMLISLKNNQGEINLGWDNYQDLQNTQTNKAFAYYNRRPYISAYKYVYWKGLNLISKLYYASYQTTSSYINKNKDGKLFNIVEEISSASRYKNYSLFYSIKTLYKNTTTDQNEQNVTGSGLIKINKIIPFNKFNIDTAVAFIYSPYRQRDNTNIFDSLPIPFSYQNIFSYDRFSMDSYSGDYKDIAASISFNYKNNTIALGQKYALKKHQAKITNSDIYDPLLTSNVSPLALYTKFNSKYFENFSLINFGDSQHFQYYQQTDLSANNNLKLNVFSFRMPIHYLYYQNNAIENINALGIGWNLQISPIWLIRGQWIIQTDKDANGYGIILKYHDCCLQTSLGLTKPLFVSNSVDTNVKYKIIASLSFDTDSVMEDNIQEIINFY